MQMQLINYIVVSNITNYFIIIISYISFKLHEITSSRNITN